MAGLPDSKKSLKISLLVLTEYTNVTDTETDRWTPHIPRPQQCENNRNRFHHRGCHVGREMKEYFAPSNSSANRTVCENFGNKF